MSEFRTSELGNKFRVAYFPPGFNFLDDTPQWVALRIRHRESAFTLTLNEEETHDLKLFLMESTGVPCLGRWTGCKIRLQGKCPWHEDCHMIDFMTVGGEKG